MASITADANGRKRIQFIGADGKRRAIRLGKASQRQAEAFKVKLESLVSARITGSIDDETGRWVAGIDDVMHGRLAAVGLLQARQGRMSTSLGAFIDAYLVGRTDIKKSTLICLGQARRRLVEYFGEGRALTSITEGDADEYGRWLASQVASNTARRLCGRAKQLFRFAVRKKIITSNPFTDLESNVRSSPAKLFFVTREMADRVTTACPNAEWRLLFALSRFGGLRCPSEHLSLQWSDVDWERCRLRVPSPKTEHIEGRASRTIPLFEEIRGPLMEVFEAAEPGATHVITRYRQLNTNLRTQFQKIVCRAGYEAWPRLFHNLRATRQTELSEILPAHVVCGWLGNPEAVARGHYLQATEEHFAKAMNLNSASAAHNPAQQASELNRSDQKAQDQNENKQAEKSVFSGVEQGSSVASIGLEPILLLGNGF